MRITLEQHEIEQALDTYVRSQISVQDNQHVTVRLQPNTLNGSIEASVNLGPMNTVKAIMVPMALPAAAVPMAVAEVAPVTTSAPKGPLKRGRAAAVTTVEPVAETGANITVNPESREPVFEEAVETVVGDPVSDPSEVTAKAPQAVSNPVPVRTSIFSGLKAVANTPAPVADTVAEDVAQPEETEADPAPQSEPVVVEVVKPKSLFSFGPKGTNAA